MKNRTSAWCAKRRSVNRQILSHICANIRTSSRSRAVCAAKDSSGRSTCAGTAKASTPGRRPNSALSRARRPRWPTSRPLAVVLVATAALPTDVWNKKTTKNDTVHSSIINSSQKCSHNLSTQTTIVNNYLPISHLYTSSCSSEKKTNTKNSCPIQVWKLWNFVSCES